MHEKEIYQKKPWYLNIRPEDQAIWDRFIVAHPDAYDWVIYNQHVGEGADIPEETQANIARDFKLLTQYKIDVVAFKNEKIDVIELKPRAGASAIGQVLTYIHLYVDYEKPSTTPRAVIITDSLRPDIAEIAAKFGVTIIVV